MSENLTEEKINRAVLVGLNAACLSRTTTPATSRWEELEALRRPPGGVCAGMVLQNKDTPDPRTFIGEGKWPRSGSWCRPRGRIWSSLTTLCPPPSSGP